MDFTEEEKEVVELLGEVWNKFIALPVKHPNDRMEFLISIHACQNIIASRVIVWRSSK